MKRGNLNVLADFGHGGDAIGFQVRQAGAGRQLAGDFVGESAEGFVAGDEIGLAIDFHQDAGPGAGLDVLGDDAFLGCARRLFWRRRPAPFLRNRSTAASMLPLVSVSAFLQSIKPAPVISRSLPTSPAVNSAMMSIMLSVELVVQAGKQTRPRQAQIGAATGAREPRGCGSDGRGASGPAARLRLVRLSCGHIWLRIRRGPG